MKYTSRQRVLDALNHREADMFPIDFASTRSTGINALAYKKLIDKIRSEDSRTVKIYDLKQLLADPERDVLELFETDCIQLHRLAPSCNLRIDKWKPEIMMDGNRYYVSDDYKPIRLQDGSYALLDAAGDIVMKRSADGLYFDDVAAPLAEISNTSELNLINKPFITDDELKYIKSRAEDLYNNTDYTVVAPLGLSIFERGIKDFGYEEWLVRIMTDQSIVQGYLERLTEGYTEVIERYLDAAGSYVQVVQVNDDLGMQSGPIIPPRLYREIFKPYQKELYTKIKKCAPHVFLLLHSCGSIREFIPDFIEVGVDALNPVQINAANMDPESLKRDFGADITFWGAGISTQSTLSFGDMKQIEDEVKAMTEIFALGGGFVFSQVHNIQADISPEKIFKVYDTVKSCRRKVCK